MIPTALDYVKKWHLQNPQSLAETATSCLYKVDRDGESLVLKLFTAVGMNDEKNGALALRCFAGKSAARLFECDDNAQLIEYIDGENLKSLVTRGDDDKAAIIISDVLNNLHQAYKGPIPQELTPLEMRFRSLFKKAELDKNEGKNSVYVKAAEQAKILLENPRDLCVLHGDMHHENVIHSGKRGWLAIDPKGLFGERTFDAANTLCNPQGMDDLVTDQSRFIKIAELLAQNLNLDRHRLFAFTFAYSCLSASWCLEDGLDPSLALKVALIAEKQLQPLSQAVF